MLKLLNEIVNQTLKNPKSGLWSRKNLTGISCIGYAMGYSTYGLIASKTTQEFVVAIFVGAGLTCLGISSWEKKHVPDQAS
jgi:hypothetical protein